MGAVGAGAGVGVACASGGAGGLPPLCDKCHDSQTVVCWTCSGTGHFELWGRREPCPTCQGEAADAYVAFASGQVDKGRRPCPECAEDRSALNQQLIPKEGKI